MPFDELVTAHLPLARRLARRYARAGQPVEDLEQVAYMGLVKAARRFDPARGCAFTTFAVPTIVGELKRHCRDTGWCVHVPRPLRERVLEVRRAARAHQARCGRDATVAELARDVDCSEEEIVEALLAERSMAAVSLDAPAEDAEGGTVTHLDRLGAEDGGYDHSVTLLAVERAMRVLGPAEVEVLRQRFAEDLTHQQIATRMAISATGVGRLLDRALSRVRAELDEAA